MATVCSIQSINERLSSWGLGEVKVQRMRGGGGRFLISIVDDDLFLMLEDLHWSYLKEIFVEVELWLESLKQPDRATWLEASAYLFTVGISQVTTFKRLAEMWALLNFLEKMPFVLWITRNCPC
ncbi:hypothetical protein V6N13_147996 [Hibiscus sabdariffa]